LGATYRLDDRLTLFGGYNTGFDVENSAGSFTAQGDPLKPETSNQFEAGLRFGTPKAQASLSVFQIQRTNAITPDLENDGFSLQIGKLRVRGVELEGTFQPIDGLTLSAGYAYLASRIVRSNEGDEGGRLGDTPRSQANARISYTLPNIPLTFRIAGNYVGKRLLTNASRISLEDYFVLDAGLGLALGKFTFDATLSNAFDKHYVTASGNANSVLPGDPLQFSLRVSVAL
jgi:iron complex outermembrane receptor protein